MTISSVDIATKKINRKKLTLNDRLKRYQRWSYKMYLIKGYNKNEYDFNLFDLGAYNRHRGVYDGY